MAEKERQLFKPESVAPWFTADVKLGSLAIHLETPSCFAAGAWNPVLCPLTSSSCWKYVARSMDIVQASSRKDCSWQQSTRLIASSQFSGSLLRLCLWSVVSNR